MGAADWLRYSGTRFVQTVTMSPLVLRTMANSSLCSVSGTLNLSMVSSKSLQKATHSLSVILRCSWDARMARPVYFCGPPVAQHNHLGHIVFEACALTR